MLAIATVGDGGASTCQQQSGHSNRDDIGTRVGDDIAITLGSGTLHQSGNCLLQGFTSCVDLLLRGVAVVGDLTGLLQRGAQSVGGVVGVETQVDGGGLV